MKYYSRVGIGLLIGLLLGITLSTTVSVFADKDSATTSSNTLPLDELRQFTDVYVRIKNDYVVDVDDKTLLENAIRGMLSGLDPHSAYLDAEDFKELQIGTSGEFGGLGIEVGMEDGFVKVISPIDDTPAQRAGVKAGDLIIRLDDTPVKGMSLNDAVKKMRGKKGTPIVLTIVREGEAKPLTIRVVRDTIQVRSVKQRMLEPGYGYLRITSFQSKTTAGLIDAIEKLEKENKGKLKGLILDLRNNPGGVLTGAVGVSDAFLDKGLIVYTEGRVQDSKLRYNASPGDIINNVPLIVLVNGGSASASEIVAGALQDQHRALIVGTKTFGKGSVQTILPLKSDAAIKLTTARYYTPSGRSIQAEGIEPDIKLKALEVSKVEDTGIEPLKEADLSGHLENGNGENKSDKSSKKDADEEALATKDYQLYEALNILKGMSIVTTQ
jgi:carboxyl-terminal processing protease